MRVCRQLRDRRLVVDVLLVVFLVVFEEKICGKVLVLLPVCLRRIAVRTVRRERVARVDGPGEVDTVLHN